MATIKSDEAQVFFPALRAATAIAQRLWNFPESSDPDEAWVEEAEYGVWEFGITVTLEGKRRQRTLRLVLFDRSAFSRTDAGTHPRQLEVHGISAHLGTQHSDGRVARVTEIFDLTIPRISFLPQEPIKGRIYIIRQKININEGRPDLPPDDVYGFAGHVCEYTTPYVCADGEEIEHTEVFTSLRTYRSKYSWCLSEMFALADRERLRRERMQEGR